jgi:WhiB family redox-sensing transcriptional regulator
VTTTIFGALVGAPLLSGANCLGLWSLFDEPDREDPDRREVVASAQRLCETCPALTDCGDWYDSLPPSQRPSGVVAGRLRRSTRYPKKDSAA